MVYDLWFQIDGIFYAWFMIYGLWFQIDGIFYAWLMIYVLWFQIDGWYYAWNFPNTLLFTLSIMTTIGYGQIAPKEQKTSQFQHLSSPDTITLKLFLQKSSFQLDFFYLEPTQLLIKHRDFLTKNVFILLYTFFVCLLLKLIVPRVSLARCLPLSTL